ncbi:type II toxin-antitoxin system Phd/YefM family antitoxin [Streptosporangium sp. OZ121]
MSVRHLRDRLGRPIDVAHFTGEPTIVERHGQPRAVLVPYAWWAER